MDNYKLECPYCGIINDMDIDEASDQADTIWNGEVYEPKCYECKRSFAVEARVTFDFTVEKLHHCDECGDDIQQKKWSNCRTKSVNNSALLICDECRESAP